MKDSAIRDMHWTKLQGFINHATALKARCKNAIIHQMPMPQAQAILDEIVQIAEYLAELCIKNAEGTIDNGLLREVMLGINEPSKATGIDHPYRGNLAKGQTIEQRLQAIGQQLVSYPV